jgi:hypothetical protein
LQFYFVIENKEGRNRAELVFVYTTLKIRMEHFRKRKLFGLFGFYEGVIIIITRDGVGKIYKI